MGKSHHPLPVKLFFGMLTPEPPLFDTCIDILSREYGPLDYRSETRSWNMTNYYRTEMGTGILRKFIFCERLIDPAVLPAIKQYANTLENTFAVPGAGTLQRRINIDPGYLTEAKVVLATTKDFSHRVYIGSDIYAEVTLRYSTRERRFIPMDYTYPDYRSEDYVLMFNQARELLRKALHTPSSGVTRNGE
ncbi:MAG TPA: DUF4416 family protein [Nitrospirota bacterium]|nr:DUF4416 family protein [Nitrospirota bacterium]